MSLSTILHKKNGIIPLLSVVVVIILLLITAYLVSSTKHTQTNQSHADSATLTTNFAPGTVPGCQFQKADSGFTVAFCDTFDQPMGTGNRSGDLNGTVWGASRLSDGWNAGQGQYNYWYSSQLNKCGTFVTATATSDVQICNGEVVETTSNDGGEGGEVSLNMYPKQPFDIAGRTGTVTFDVTADSQGPHAAWPTFWYTDQPVPAPLADVPPNTIGSNARNGFGFALDAYGNNADNMQIPNCSNDNDTSVGEMFVTNNYVLSTIPFTTLGCVKRPNTPGSQLNSVSTALGSPLNHFEVRISQTSVQVWGTDPGSTTLKELATANINLPFSRGLIWIEDVRYNASKFNDQASHTFGWDNVGFDGPVLPRDSANDVNDANSTGNLGWGMFNTGSLSVNVPDVSQATGALLTFNWSINNNTVGSFKYRLNSNAWNTVAYPYGSNALWSPRTLGIPVPLNQVVNGTNKIDFDFSGVTGAIVSNVDLILVGGQGLPACYDPSNCAGSQFNVGPTITPGGPNSTPTTVPTNTPVPTSTMAPTLTPTKTPTPSRTPTPSVTATPTIKPTNTPVPTVTSVPNSTKLSLTVGLDGIGKAGDNVSRTSTGNVSPLHPTRTVTLTLSDQNNTPLQPITGQITYDTTSGLFKGVVSLPSSVTTGFYTLKVASPSFLQKSIAAIISITAGQTTTIPTVDLTAGDINNDNQVSLLDYNSLLGCFGSTQSSCSPSDLDDDGTVGGADYNLFLRELSVQNGG